MTAAASQLLLLRFGGAETAIFHDLGAASHGYLAINFKCGTDILKDTVLSKIDKNSSCNMFLNIETPTGVCLILLRSNAVNKLKISF